MTNFPSSPEGDDSRFIPWRQIQMPHADLTPAEEPPSVFAPSFNHALGVTALMDAPMGTEMGENIPLPPMVLDEPYTVTNTSVLEGAEEPDDNLRLTHGAADEHFAASVSPPDVPPTQPPDRPTPSPEGPGEPPSPQLVDQLFETIAHADQPTSHEVAEVRENRDALAWLGNDHELPALFGAFRGPLFAPYKTLPPSEANILTEGQLARYSAAVEGVHAGLRATEALAHLAARHPDHTLVERTVLEGHEPNNEHYIGQFTVSEGPNGVAVAELAEDGAPAPAHTTYVRYDHPSGEIRIVRTDSRERYRISTGDDGLVVTKETVHTLPADTEMYFRGLHALLEAHSELLEEVAVVAGFDRSTFIDATTGDLQTHFLKTAVHSAVANSTFRTGLNPSLRIGMALSNTAIWSAIIERQEPDAMTGRVELEGLRARGFVVNAYFKALLSS